MDLKIWQLYDPDRPIVITFKVAELEQPAVINLDAPASTPWNAPARKDLYNLQPFTTPGDESGALAISIAAVCFYRLGAHPFSTLI
jgi:hypothetical protein